MKKILLVEDDQSFGYILKEYMTIKNYIVDWRQTVKGAYKALDENKFDLAILDINLNNESGYGIAVYIKNEIKNLPFIFLTARDLKIEQLKGYRLGAQEFVTKPIDEEVLLAKIEVILARSQHINSNKDKEIQLSFENIFLDVKLREITINNTKKHLTERETLILEKLLKQPETLVLRKEILRDIWGNTDEFSRNSMDVYISRLRKYISVSTLVLRNIHGKGFILEKKVKS